MSLYDKVLAQLSAAERGSWQDTKAKLASVRGPDRLNHSGAQTVGNIENEQQLSRNPATMDHRPMVAVLGRLCTFVWSDSSTAMEAARNYETRLRGFELQATPIHVQPTRLFRYVDGAALFERIEIALDEARHYQEASRVRRVLDKALRGLGTWSDVLSQVLAPAVWSRIPREEVPLGNAAAMFVSFDGAPPLERISATRVAAALALWIPAPMCMVQLAYSPQPGDRLLFPTFVEAGWFRFFRPAPLGEPHGWTAPRPPTPAEGPEPPQPEAVQERLTLERVAPEGLSVLGP